MAKIRPDDDDRFGMQTSAETKLANKNKNRHNKTKNNFKKNKNKRNACGSRVQAASSKSKAKAIATATAKSKSESQFRASTSASNNQTKEPPESRPYPRLLDEKNPKPKKNQTEKLKNRQQSPGVE